MSIDQQGAARPGPVINSSIPFPEPLRLDGNVRENVELWKDAFDTYIIASGVEQLEERVKVATFKSALGAEARRIFNLWPLRDEEKNTVAACLQSLSSYMIPQKNIKLARYEFHQCQQEPGDDSRDPESMSNFINRARLLVKDCNFGDLEDEMLRDKIITGIQDMHLKKKLIETADLTSAKVVEICRAEEATRAEMERNRWLEVRQHDVNKIVTASRDSKQCGYCGRSYHKNLSECPARGATCHFCKLRNHFEVVCKKKKEQNKQSGISGSSKRAARKQVHTVDCESDRPSAAQLDND